MSGQYSVLFVCLGNICRSPMAEAIFNHIVKEMNSNVINKVDSAGTSGYHNGELPDSRSIKKCKERGVKVNDRSRKLAKQGWHDFDYILCMDRFNLRDLEKVEPKNPKARVALLGSFDPQGELIIEDPYYGGDDGFEKNFQQCYRACNTFLDTLETQAGN